MGGRQNGKGGQRYGEGWKLDFGSKYTDTEL